MTGYPAVGAVPCPMGKLVSGRVASFMVASRLSGSTDGVGGPVGRGVWRSELLIHPTYSAVLLAQCRFALSFPSGSLAMLLSRASQNPWSSADCFLLKVIQAEPRCVVGALGMRARLAFSSWAVAMAISVRLSWTAASTSKSPS